MPHDYKENNKPPLAIIYNNLTTLQETYLAKHSKMFVVRADARYPQTYGQVEDNKHIQIAMANTIQFFSRHDLDPAYMWVREKHNSTHPHYHCIFLLNGHKTNHAWLVYKTLARYWENAIGVKGENLIHHCPFYDGPHRRYGRMIFRNDDSILQIKGIILYLAKDQYKGDPKDGLRDFGMSRLERFKKK